MRRIVIAPTGERVKAETLAGYTVRMIAEGDVEALGTLHYARESSEVTDFPELVALVDAVLSAPHLAIPLMDDADNVTVGRFATAIALACVACIPGASVALEPETREDHLWLASMHPQPLAVQ